MKQIMVVLLLLLAGGVLAQIGVGGSNGGYAPFKGPTSYKDADTGIIFYVESDGRHVVALDKDGKILWCRDPFVDAKLKPYRTEYPQINYIGRPQKELAEVRKDKGSGKFVAISFNSSQFGLLDVKDGTFLFEGQD